MRSPVNLLMIISTTLSYLSTTRLHSFSSSSSLSSLSSTTANSNSNFATTPPHLSSLANAATTTPSFLHALWSTISHITQCESSADCPAKFTLQLTFPNMPPSTTATNDFISRIMAHLDQCRDVTDQFGINIVVSPNMVSNKFDGSILVKKLSDWKPQEEFAYDPMWDDYVEPQSESESESEAPASPPPPQALPDNSEIEAISRDWVGTFMSKMGVCPFSVSASLAGLPVGPVRYEITHSATPESLYASYWGEVCKVEQSSESELSTTLLITPEFLPNDIENFEAFTTTLTSCLEALQIER